MSTVAVKKIKLGDNADTSKNLLIEVPAVADGTLTIKRENGTNILSIDATGKAVIPGVVGTVAQVGGVPTGQVVERGSNANGEYVRFADGTQICFKSGVTPVAWAANSAGAVSPSPTFPAAFSSSPVAHAQLMVTEPFRYWAAVSATSPTAVSIYVGGTAGSASGAVYYIAIGRWF